jgi:hypothetical protein
VLALPTATEYIFTTLPHSTSAILRAGMFTISRRVGAVCAANSPAAANRIVRNFKVCIAVSPLPERRNADRAPARTPLIPLRKRRSARVPPDTLCQRAHNHFHAMLRRLFNV